MANPNSSVEPLRSLAPRLDLLLPADVGHFVQFYGEDAHAVDAAQRFFATTLAGGGRHVAIVTKAHGEGLTAALSSGGFDIAGLTRRGTYVVLDAEELLGRLLVDGFPDPGRFASIVGDQVRRFIATDPERPPRIFGEMVALLCAQGRHQAAVRLEELWNDLARQARFSLLCAYPMRAFRTTADAAAFEQLCTEHAYVIPAESFTGLPGTEEQLRAVSHLQQQAQALATEAAERIRVEAALREKVCELADMDRRKDEFLAMLGHELRNPLSAIRNALAAVDSPHRERAIDIARRQTDQLARLVDDLLDVARITQGRLQVTPERLRFAPIVERAVETIRPSSATRTVTLRVSPVARELEVDGDPMRLEQVIINLLSNASKYTVHDGRVEVSVDRDGDVIVLRVRDDGIGISPEMMPRVFDLFVQGQHVIDRTHGGLGVGLAVARRIVALHGGRIDAYSAGAGKGSELIVQLPMASSQAKEATPPPRETNGTRARVLIVEDNTDAAESLAMLLELYGHEAQLANSGGAALTAAGAMVPDAMIVDIGLPDMDGYEVARRVRNEPVLARVLLVALTGYGREEDRQEAIAAGFDRHLVKPVNPELLKELLSQIGRT